MRTHTTTALAAGALLALTSCADQTPGSAAVREASVTARETADGSTGSADLIIPGATKEQARAAIRDHARGIRGAELYYIKVQHSEAASRYVCRARWYADPDAYRAHSGSTEAWPDSWPHLAINCP
ncbi:hypothetical protein SAMN04487981_101616 [Streptomyces sp. cf386]|uniref:hypothetical protein n=1 Tax=Streptomyces sp. cf386 TaxID=1761904 RepID=UPI00088BCD21|nr:hypothetical protein [Streptomyces sp. cf386]SDM46744.1 hypothetical protein SAMN04487981_101616 [Streptomyces sp. cf386]